MKIRLAKRPGGRELRRWLVSPAPLATIAVLLGVVILGGCSSEKVEEAMAAAKAKTQDLAAKTKEATADAGTQLREATQTIQEQTGQIVETSRDEMGNVAETIQRALPGSGFVHLQTTPPMSADAGHWRLHEVNGPDGRVILFEVTTYRDEGTIDRFPAVMLSGTLPSRDSSQSRSPSFDAIAEWVGKTIDVQLNAQASADGPILFATRDNPVTIQIESMDPESGQVIASMESASVQATNGADVTIAGGQMELHWNDRQPAVTKLTGANR